MKSLWKLQFHAPEENKCWRYVFFLSESNNIFLRMHLKNPKNFLHFLSDLFVLQVTLWKESMDGQWACISDVSKGQGAVSAITDTQQSEQWHTQTHTHTTPVVSDESTTAADTWTHHTSFTQIQLLAASCRETVQPAAWQDLCSPRHLHCLKTEDLTTKSSSSSID